MPKLFVRVTVTQFDDDGGNRVEEHMEHRLIVHKRCDEVVLAESLLEHINDELKYQIENSKEEANGYGTN